jgi:uncharacterized protein YndB with AHSA1/START domain
VATISESVDIAADRQEVWTTLADPEKMGEWNSAHVGFTGDVPSELNEGDSFTEKVTMMGMPAEIQWTVAEVDEGSKIALNGAGPMGTTASTTLSLSGDNGSTTVTMESGFDGAALAAMAAPLEAASRKMATDSLGKLKALHE